MKVRTCIFWVLGIAVVTGATAIGIRMATAPTEFSVTSTYAFPVFPNLTEIIQTPDEVKQAVAVDNKIVYANTDEQQPTASTAKMILALMVMEKAPFNLGETGESITITAEMYDKYVYYATHNGSHSKVQKGEVISEYDALASVMLVSSNNMADSLAIWAFGSIDEYKAFASARLKEWGMTNTTIGIDASGYSETTTSTASELALIAQKVMANPVLAEIVATKTRDVPVAGTIENTNKILDISGIIGVKTGYIGNSSGYCLVSAYRMDEHIVTVVVLNAKSREDSFSISQQSVETLQEKFAETALVKNGDEIGYLDSWWTGKIPIRSAEDVGAIVTSNSQVDSSVKKDSFMIGVDGERRLVQTTTESYKTEPDFWQRLQYAFRFQDSQ